MLGLASRRGCKYFSAPSYLGYSVEKGVLRASSGSRLVAVNDEWLRGFVAALDHETGAAASGILRRCGVTFGRRFAQRFESEVTTMGSVHLRDRTMNEFCILLDDLWMSSGMGKLKLDWTHVERFVSVRLEGSPMQDIGSSGHTGDELFAGVLEGFFSHFSDAPLQVLQTGDERLGDREGTTFLVGAPDAIEVARKLHGESQRHSEIVRALSEA